MFDKRLPRNGAVFWMGIGLTGLLISGCSHSRLRASRPHGEPLPPAIAAEYAYAKAVDLPVKMTVLEDRSNFTIKRIQLNVPDEGGGTNRLIGLDYYEIKSEARTPVVLVLPMSGGGYSIERHFASYFAGRGYAAVIVHRDKVPQNEQLIENLNGMMKRMVLDHKRVIDWLETQPHDQLSLP